MKNTIRQVLFACEELAGSLLGFLMRPFRPVAAGFFTSMVRSAHLLGNKPTMLLTPLLMEFGRAALDNRRPIWLSHTLVGGLSIRLDLTEKTQRNIFLANVYETGLTKFVVSALEPGDVFVDVGANVGYYTLVAAAHVGEKGCVIACEPEEQNFGLLGVNVERNHCANVRLLQIAVGDREGTTTLHINPLNRGGNSVLPFATYKTGAHTYTRASMEQTYGTVALEQNVRMRTLDKILEDEQISSIRVLKIDVEGFEKEVFAGMRETLARGTVEHILCEVGNVSGRESILALMRTAGYMPYTVNSQGETRPIDREYPRDILFSRKYEYDIEGNNQVR